MREKGIAKALRFPIKLGMTTVRVLSFNQLSCHFAMREKRTANALKFPIKLGMTTVRVL
ncbi:hypothetical protein ACFOG5_09145 [Pedobacter fastidiosus]|uniref:hypothetical protein n=1 Tax=Pedobacter fastidiosus TaxID=2765361 RepID=UPI00360F8EDC